MLRDMLTQPLPFLDPYILPTESISALLSALGRIRIVINPGGGMGSQKASFTLMRKLRDLGFSGLFDICYYDVANGATNIHVFAADFDPKISDDQNFIHPELGELYFHRLPYQEIAHDLPFVELGFTAAEHHTDSLKKSSDSFKAVQYHCANYVTLNPSGWPNSDVPKQIELFTRHETRALSPDARLKDTQKSLKFEKQLIPSFPLAHLLEKIVTAQAEDAIKFALIYGLDQDKAWLAPEEELARLAEAIQKANLKKPVVFVVPYPKTLITHPERLRACATLFDEHTFESLKQKLNTGHLPTDRVSIVFTDQLPEPCFDALAKHSFFTVAEGCNLIESMESVKHPYLHGGRDLTELLTPKKETPESIEMSQSQIQLGANKHLTQRCAVDSAPLVRWLILLNEQHPAFLSHLEERYQLYLRKPDAVEEALNILLTAQHDCSQDAFVHQLFQELSKRLEMQASIQLEDPQLTVLLARLYQLIPRYEKNPALKTWFLCLIQKCLDLIKQAVLNPDNPFAKMLFYFKQFCLSTPQLKPATPTEKKRKFSKQATAFLNTYLSDEKAREQLFDTAMADFETALKQSLLAPTAHLDEISTAATDGTTHFTPSDSKTPDNTSCSFAL